MSKPLQSSPETPGSTEQLSDSQQEIKRANETIQKISEIPEYFQELKHEATRLGDRFVASMIGLIPTAITALKHQWKLTDREKVAIGNLIYEAVRYANSINFKCPKKK